MRPSRYTQLRDGFVPNAGSDALSETEHPVTNHVPVSKAEQFLIEPENDIRQSVHENTLDERPLSSLQGKVATATLQQLEAKQGIHTPEAVAHFKEQFIHSLGEAFFPGLAAQRIGVPLKLIKAWLKSDSDFAERAIEQQGLMPEKVGVTLLAEGLHQKDTASLMFLVKQFGDVFQKPIQANFDEMQEAVNPLGDISRLTMEEQQMLLHLLRKSKTSESTDTAFTPTVFDESDPDVSTSSISHEPHLLFPPSNAIPQTLPHFQYPIDPSR